MQFNPVRESFNLEIETLLHNNHQRHEGDEVYSVIAPSVESDFPAPEYSKSRSRHASSKQTREYSRSRYDSAGSSEEDEQQQQAFITVCVNGADIGDLPTEYTVEGIRNDEFPVIGTYVDKRILPGFRYRVRKLGSVNPDRYLFKGKALTLQSVGRGYGKRLTFEGEMLNQNSNYFYSDTNPAGFALSLVAVEPQDQFTITVVEDEHTVAEAKIIEVMAQEEMDSWVDEKKLVKQVRVSVTFDVEYTSDTHGLMSLYSRQRLQATGRAIVERQHRARKAFTTFIEDIELPHHGLIVFRA